MSAVTLTRDEIACLQGIPETCLQESAMSRLPTHTPPAPWRVQMSSLMWWHRARPAAAGALPAGLERRRGPGVTSAGFIKYADTPVGPYSEVIASPLQVRGGLAGRVHIPFIAVDSLRSVHAGRAHWALPKVPAAFTWTGETAVRAAGPGWWLTARVVRTGPPVPLVGRATCVQVRPDGRHGTARVSMRGRGRLVRVDVEVDATASYASWLLPGRHLGVLVSSATMSTGPTSWERG